MSIVIAFLLLLILWVLAPEVVIGLLKIAAGLAVLALIGFVTLLLAAAHV